MTDLRDMTEEQRRLHVIALIKERGLRRAFDHLTKVEIDLVDELIVEALEAR